MACGFARGDVSRTTGTAPLGLAILLACMSTLSPFSIDTFFPSFRVMQADFHVTALQMQQTLTSYMLPYAIMSLFHGSLSDALGRRRVVLVGLAVYAAASLACMLAPSFASLLMFRAAQGLSAGAGMVVARAIIRDLYDGAAAQRLMSTVTMMFSAAPLIAPIVGGWIHVWLGWRAVFALLAVLSLSLLLACYRELAETHPLERRVSFKIGVLLSASRGVVADTFFRLIALASALVWSATLIYIADAPAMVFDHWKLGATQFGWLFLPIIAGIAGGAWLSGRMAGRLAPRRQTLYGFALCSSAALIIGTAHSLSSSIPVFWQQVALMGMSLGSQLATPVLNLAMLDRFPHLRGTASSVQGFVSLLVGAAVMGIVGPQLQDSLLLLSGYSLAAVAAASGLWYMASKHAH